MDNHVISDQGQQCLQKLMTIWFDFERQLGRIPIISRLEKGQFDEEDYRSLLINMRQQVIEGSRWISRTASSFDRDYSDVRSEIIQHAKDEHRDYLVLEQDYINVGGKREDIQRYDRNAGTEALHAFMMHRASQPNPIDMIGAMWIIEGLGHKMANGWAKQIQSCLKSDKSCTQFMQYHGENDQEHLEKLYKLIDRVCQNDQQLKSITRTARVVGRLYALQLEEIDV
ncbi:iron-containing redox enzyme family protein [Vibrio rumoiensis]|uniref:3-oxoacyl-ACP synthase n=1 Tax=Vibrio rumoiensis 1S-45 TaxID=1188252 RepID=A0A1E5E138_9VIBR|nr:iron-containing redox enzyme family protein [Vibrio rumoiensis]OEF24236.1 hypothetical protein A1QC_10465 [Vibrio rumoiensis 1S-45]